MTVPMMDVRVMRVAVCHGLMLVRMDMGLNTIPNKVMTVLMVFVMPVAVAMV